MELTLPAVSYILSFFNDVKQLTDNLAGYGNQLLLIQSRIGQTDINEEKFSVAIRAGKITEDDKSQAIVHSNNLRYWATQCFIKFSGLKDRIPELKKDFPELEKNYRIIQKTICPEYETIERYVILCNQLFSNTALSELYIKSEAYYQKLGGLNEPVDETQ